MVTHETVNINEVKPYFSKALKAKSVRMDIYAQFEGDELVAQSAGSADLDRINREIIDSVKFRFVHKSIIGRRHWPVSDDQILGLSGLQDVGNNQKIFLNIVVL